MSKIAIVVFSDTDTVEALGKVSNAFMFANEAVDHGDDLKIIFEGAGSKWIGELENEDHKLHGLYAGLKSHITGVCFFCARAFGVKSQVEEAGIPLLSEYKDHPSLRNLVVVVEPDARPDTRHKMESDEYYALLESDRPVFIDFYAPWCGPCRQMMPMIDSLQIAYAGRIDVVKINADASKRLVKELQIGSVPYFSMFYRGEEVFSHAGMLEEERVTEAADLTISNASQHLQVLKNNNRVK